MGVNALMAHPTAPCPHPLIQLSNSAFRLSEIAKSQRKSAPVCGSGPGGRPHSSLLPSPQGEGVGAPTRRIARITPGGVSGLLRTMGVKRHAPRLAARQRGIFAFRHLTVVGPGRLLVAGEAARVRPGDEVASPIARRCRSRSPPTERLRKAPLVLGSGWPQNNYAFGEVKQYSLLA